jgi:hypothetical protein
MHLNQELLRLQRCHHLLLRLKSIVHCNLNGARELPLPPARWLYNAGNEVPMQSGASIPCFADEGAVLFAARSTSQLRRGLRCRVHI